MIAAVDERVPCPTQDFRPRGAGEALLIDQLSQATRELRMGEAEGRSIEQAGAIVRSLRRTLLTIAKHGNVLGQGTSHAALRCTTSGELELWHGGKRLGVRSAFLRAMFDAAGVQVQPGQLILMDPSLSQRAIEESLLALTLEELRIREEKRSLFLALRETTQVQGRPESS